MAAKSPVASADISAWTTDEHETRARRVAPEAREHLEGVRRRPVQIVEPDQHRPVVADLLEDAADDRVAELRRVEHEALPGGTERRHGAGRRRAQPLGGRGDPRERLVVVLGDLPAVDQRLLDERAVRALQAEKVVHRAGEAVERRRDATVARAKRPHQALLVQRLAEPLGEATLADAGLADDEGDLATALAGGREPLDKRCELRLSPRIRRQSFANGGVDTRLQAGFSKHAMRRGGPLISQQSYSAFRHRMNEWRDQALTFRRDQNGVASSEDRQAVSALHDASTHGISSWPAVQPL
jgi:hypothetical protein